MTVIPLPRAGRAATVTGITADELCKSHWVSMVKMAVLMVDDRQTAEDAVQDAFEAVYKKTDLPSDYDAAIAYLRGIVINKCRMVIRRRIMARRKQSQVTTHDSVDTGRIAACTENMRLVAALQSLPRRMREVVVLRYYVDLTEAQTAKQLGISVGTVKSTSSKAFAKIRRTLSAGE